MSSIPESLEEDSLQPQPSEKGGLSQQIEIHTNHDNELDTLRRNIPTGSHNWDCECTYEANDSTAEGRIHLICQPLEKYQDERHSAAIRYVP